MGFDLDLTLVDSTAGIAATLRAALAPYGRTVSDEQVWPHIGIPLEDTVRILLPDLDPVAVSDRYRRLYPTTGIAPIRLLPGAAEAVEAVHALGGRVLVVSAKVEPAVRQVLRHVGLDRGARAPDEVAGGLFAAAKGVRLLRAGAGVYVGDHPGDMEAARVGGAVALGVGTGSFAPEQLLAAGADAVLPDLTGFPDWLREHLDAALPA